MALIHWKQIDGDLTGSRVLTGSLGISGSINLTGSVEQSSGSFTLNFDGATDYFSVNVSGEEKLRINEEGTLQMKAQTTTPTAVSGGLFYSASNDFFLGFRD